MTMTRPVAGEIIAVTTTTFTAQSGALNEAPAFGSLLRVANPRRKAGDRGDAGAPGGRIAAYYALCYGSQTGSIEPGRHAVAWGRFEDDEEDIYQRQPQLAQVLRTTFDALLVGYEMETPTPLASAINGASGDGAELVTNLGARGGGGGAPGGGGVRAPRRRRGRAPPPPPPPPPPPAPSIVRRSRRRGYRSVERRRAGGGQ